METPSASRFGSPFERWLVSLLALGSALTLAYLAIEGPLFLHHIRYRTAEVIKNQLVGQDAINLFLMAPLLCAGGVALCLKRKIAPYLLLLTPLSLIYFVLSYTIGWEWSSPNSSGNSQLYTFHFLFILISSLVILLYSLSVFPRKVECSFPRGSLAAYSVLFSLLLLLFASMWIKEVLEVISSGTTRGYDLAPTAFWVVRIFDLGFTIPLGFLSIYLLWARAQSSYPVQFMFYGFFLTMIFAVNAMGFVMYLQNDPTFLLRDLIVFLLLALVVLTGFVFILRHYKVRE